MESRFKRGDVIKENFKNTMKYVVLSTIHPEVIDVYSSNGYASAIFKDHEKAYKKIGSIDLKPLMEQIRKTEYDTTN